MSRSYKHTPVAVSGREPAYKVISNKLIRRMSPENKIPNGAQYKKYLRCFVKDFVCYNTKEEFLKMYEPDEKEEGECYWRKHFFSK